jgi:uncharacterized protein (TIGR03083 family)
MAQQAKDAIAALRQLHDELVSFVEGLDAENLTAQSGAAEWKVADVLSHLGSSAEIGRNTLTTGKADMGGAHAIWDRWNAMAPGDQAANFVAAGEQLVAALEALDDDALVEMKVDLGFLPFPVDIAFFTGMRLGEVGLHGWDVAVAFDPAATVASYVAPFVLGQLPMFAGFFAKPIGKTGRIAVEMTDPTGAYVVDVGDEGTALREDGADDAGTRLTVPAESFVRLTAGRLAPDHTPESVTIEGELSLDDLRALFPGY